MRKFSNWRAAMTAAVLCGLPHSASASGASFYDSVVAGIAKANAQAMVYLKKGVWRTNVADTDMIWDIQSSNRARIEVAYKNGQISRGLVDLIAPITVTIRNTTGVCTVIRFKHLEYGDGGFFQGNSDLKIVGSSNCNDASGVVEVEKHLALTNDPADFFRGRIFTSLSNAPIGAANLSRPPIES
jgi:hypothetical protein